MQRLAANTVPLPPVVENLPFKLSRDSTHRLCTGKNGENGGRNSGRTLGGVRLPLTLTAQGLVLFVCVLSRQPA